MKKTGGKKYRCPACRAWLAGVGSARQHWDETDDDAHRALADGIERAADDAYFDAETDFVESKCEER